MKILQSRSYSLLFAYVSAALRAARPQRTLTEESGGLCHRLTIPAPRVTPMRCANEQNRSTQCSRNFRPDLSYDTQKNWEIPRSEVMKIEKLGYERV